MRSRVSTNAAREQITFALNEGYQVLSEIRAEYKGLRSNGTYDPDRDNASFRKRAHTWAVEVVNTLNAIFPTVLEANKFKTPSVSALGRVGENAQFGSLVNWLEGCLRQLDAIKQTSSADYTDLPTQARLFIQDI